MEYTWIEATITEALRAVIRKVKKDQVRTENLNQSIQRRFLAAQTADSMPKLKHLAKFTTKIQRLSAYLDGEAIPRKAASHLQNTSNSNEGQRKYRPRSNR